MPAPSVAPAPVPAPAPDATAVLLATLPAAPPLGTDFVNLTVGPPIPCSVCLLVTQQSIRQCLILPAVAPLDCHSTPSHRDRRGGACLSARDSSSVLTFCTVPSCAGCTVQIKQNTDVSLSCTSLEVCA